MTRFFLSALLWVPVAGFAQSAQENTVRRRDAAPAKFWMRQYPIRRYAAAAHLDLAVADFDRSYKKLLRWIEKFDGEASSLITRDPKDTVTYQQFSVVFERKKAARFLARARRLGTARRDTRREILYPEIPGEAKTKLARLELERASGRENLRALSSVRAALDELIAHLRQAVDAYEASQDKILINLVLEQPDA